MTKGWYCLHKNGTLLFRKGRKGKDSDTRGRNFVIGLWSFNSDDRAQAWNILVEALAGGAKKGRIGELATLWNCDDTDALLYGERSGCRLFQDSRGRWCATRKDYTGAPGDPIGLGVTCLDAMANLAKAMGFVPSKMFRKTFRDLLADDYSIDGLLPG